ncbi:small, acid-soluble spore protein, alpha/beta type, partial [Clostridium botulinum]|nr:small, acid-soluble spore protein, alpha/beta type [Clostridium botulinum]
MLEVKVALTRFKIESSKYMEIGFT